MQRVFNFLRDHHAESVAIFSHVRGDGDCLGAQTGLAEILFSAGFPIALYNQEVLSENFGFLPRFDEIRPFDEVSPLPDVCIAVDCATLERIGNLPEAILSRPWINIDHHISNDAFGDLNIIDGNASSTCEIISKMVFEEALNINSRAATALFSGISTDTGSFLYPSANAQTFYIAAQLLQAGANKNLVQEHIFENTSKKKVEILQYLYAHIQYLQHDAVAYCMFSNETMDMLDASALDLEGIVSLIKEIQGVEVAVLFTEAKKGACKVSLRSRDRFDCNRCCSTFGGGGHIRASGATLQRPFEDAVNAVLQEIVSEWEAVVHA